MKTPSEERIARSIELLGEATHQAEVANAAASLTKAIGLERYFILDIRGGMGSEVRGLYHDAPAMLRDEASDLRVFGSDPVLVKARTSRVPFLWRAEGNAWRDKNGALGYRSGVAAASYDGNGSGAIVILSGADECIQREHESTALAYALMAAVTVASAFERFAKASRPASPLTPRELDCLLYALVGKSAKETARALDIEPRTVNQYLERARSKLQAPTSYAAATQALGKGWLDLRQALELAGLASPGAGNVLAGK